MTSENTGGSRGNAIGKRLRKGTLEAFVLQGAGAAAVFIMHSVLARKIGAAGYGTLSYALSIVGVLSVIAALGWPNAILRLASEYAGSERWGLLRGALRRAHQSAFLLSLILSLVLAGVAQAWSPGAGLKTSLRYAAALLPVLAYLTLRRRAFQGLHWIKTSIVLEDVALPAAVTVVVVAFSVSTAAGAFASYWAVAAAIAVAGGVLLTRCLPAAARAAAPEYRNREWAAIALPMLLGALGTIVMNRADAVVLGTMVDMDTVGVYSAASRIAQVNVFVLASANTIAAPMLAHAHHAGNPKHFTSIRRQAMGLSTLGALPLCAIMLVFPAELLGLFGQEFSRGVPLLRILALGQLVNAATGPVGFALLMSGRERLFAITTATTAAVGVVALLVVIPRAGALGAAWVSAASLAVLNLWQYYFAGRAAK